MNNLETKNTQLLLDEIEKYCYTTAKVTYLTTDKQFFTMELIREDNGVTYGLEWEDKTKFLEHLPKGGVLIIRSFTSDKDLVSGLPVKELRGLIIKPDLTFLRLEPEALFNALYTDPKTGEALPVEQAVRYY